MISPSAKVPGLEWRAREPNPGRRAVETRRRHSLPRFSPTLLRLFTSYCRRYIRQHFHTVRVSRGGLPLLDCQLPVVVYANHASWWDPLVFLAMREQLFPAYTPFAPIDAEMLRKYRFFGRLGFFGVEQHSPRGAAQFLRTAEAVLGSPQHLLALTPQGRFADARERPPRFKPGLGHLAFRVRQAVFVPLCMEYVFWDERLPEVLVRFGEPIEVRPEHPRRGPAEWTTHFEQRMLETQEALAREAQLRRGSDFRILLRGGAGQGGIYDLWRGCKALWRGEPFKKEHGVYES